MSASIIKMQYQFSKVVVSLKQLANRTIVTGSALLLLCACGSVNTKPNSHSVSAVTQKAPDAKLAFEQGQHFWQQWENEESLGALEKAYQHYQNAFKLEPHNARYQRAFYLAFVYNSFYTESVDEPALLGLYNNLQNSVRLDVPPPARVSYALANIQDKKPEILITHAQRAIQQQALDALSWKQLSEQYLKLQQTELAAVSAWRALELDEENADYHGQFAEILAALSQSRACNANAENNMLLAAKHSAKAAAKGENKAWRLANSSEKYIALGLLPLARHQINRSLTMESNAANVSAHIKTSLLEGRNFQTDAFVEKAENTLHTKDSYIALAMASAANGNWEYAEEFMTMAKAQERFDIVDQSIYYWLALLANKEGDQFATLEKSTAQTREETAIKEWLINDYAHNLDLSTAFGKSNRCTQLKEDFYSALKLWKKGNVVSAREHLHAVTNSDFYNAREKVWAAAILQGMQSNRK